MPTEEQSWWIHAVSGPGTPATSRLYATPMARGCRLVQFEERSPGTRAPRCSGDKTAGRQQRVAFTSGASVPWIESHLRACLPGLLSVTLKSLTPLWFFVPASFWPFVRAKPSSKESTVCIAHSLALARFGRGYQEARSDSSPAWQQVSFRRRYPIRRIGIVDFRHEPNGG